MMDEKSAWENLLKTAKVVAEDLASYIEATEIHVGSFERSSLGRLQEAVRIVENVQEAKEKIEWKR